MHVNPHTGSIRVVAAGRYFRHQYALLCAVKADLQQFKERLSVVQPKRDQALNEEEQTEITVDEVLSGRETARLRLGGKFIGLEKAQTVWHETMAKMMEQEKELKEVRQRLYNLLGGKEAGEYLGNLRKQVHVGRGDQV